MFISYTNALEEGIRVDNSSYGVRLYAVEDFSSPDYIASTYHDLVSEHSVKALMAPYSTNLSAIAINTSQSLDGILFTTCANEEVLEDTKAVFSLAPPGLKFQEAAFTTFIGLGAESIAVIAEDDDANSQCSKADTLLLNATYHQNITLYDYIRISSSNDNYTADLTHLLNQLNKSSVETLVICSQRRLCLEV